MTRFSNAIREIDIQTLIKTLKETYDPDYELIDKLVQNLYINYIVVKRTLRSGTTNSYKECVSLLYNNTVRAKYDYLELTANKEFDAVLKLTTQRVNSIWNIKPFLYVRRKYLQFISSILFSLLWVLYYLLDIFTLILTIMRIELLNTYRDNLYLRICGQRELQKEWNELRQFVAQVRNAKFLPVADSREAHMRYLGELVRVLRYKQKHLHRNGKSPALLCSNRSWNIAVYISTVLSFVGIACICCWLLKSDFSREEKPEAHLQGTFDVRVKGELKVTTSKSTDK